MPSDSRSDRGRKESKMIFGTDDNTQIVSKISLRGLRNTPGSHIVLIAKKRKRLLSSDEHEATAPVGEKFQT